ELAGRVQEDLCAEDVGADERPRVQDAAIDVALGREVQDRVDSPTHDVPHGAAVGHVALDKAVARLAGKVGQVGEVAGVGEGVEMDDRVVGLGGQDMADEVTADEAASAGDEDGGHGVSV